MTHIWTLFWTVWFTLNVSSLHLGLCVSGIFMPTRVMCTCRIAPVMLFCLFFFSSHCFIFVLTSFPSGITAAVYTQWPGSGFSGNRTRNLGILSLGFSDSTPQHGIQEKIQCRPPPYSCSTCTTCEKHSQGKTLTNMSSWKYKWVLCCPSINVNDHSLSTML